MTVTLEVAGSYPEECQKSKMIRRTIRSFAKLHMRFQNIHLVLPNNEPAHGPVLTKKNHADVADSANDNRASALNETKGMQNMKMNCPMRRKNVNQSERWAKARTTSSLMWLENIDINSLLRKNCMIQLKKN